MAVGASALAVAAADSGGSLGTLARSAGLFWYAWFEKVVLPDVAQQASALPALEAPQPDPNPVQPRPLPQAICSPASRARPSRQHPAPASLLPAQAPELAAGLTGSVGSSIAAPGTVQRAVPYKAFLAAAEVRALMATHFCNNLYYFTLLSWLPTYFVREIGMDLATVRGTGRLGVAGWRLGRVLTWRQAICNCVAGPEREEAAPARGSRAGPSFIPGRRLVQD
jgi:hypothetical protein